MRSILIAIFVMVFSGFAHAQTDFGSKAEAEALVKRGIAYAKDVGPEKAFADFNDTKGKFVDRDLYLIVTDMSGTRLAHGQNVKLVGKNIAESTDVAGKPYGKEIVDGAKTNGNGWVEYMFSDPISKKVLPKVSYYEKSGEFIFYCGVYKR